MYFAEIRPANIQKILAPQHLRLYFLCPDVKIPSFSSSVACGNARASKRAAVRRVGTVGEPQTPRPKQGIFADNHLFFHPTDIILRTRHRGPHDSRHGRRARRTRGMLHLDAPDRRGLHAREARLGHSARRRAVHGRVGFHTPHTIRPTSATRRIRGIVAALGTDRAEPARLRSRPISDIPPLHEPFAAQDNGGNE